MKNNLISEASTPCRLRPTTYGSVCVCDENYCDYMDDTDLLPSDDGQFVFISSSSKGLRFSKSNGTFGKEEILQIKDYKENFSRTLNPSVILNVRGIKPFNLLSSFQSYQRTSSIFIDRREKYQHVIGFGGAFTGSVAHILDQVPEKLQNHVYKSYYSHSGIGYNMMRLSIGGSDFDLEPWAYNEEPQNEVKLSNFTKLDARDEDKVSYCLTYLWKWLNKDYKDYRWKLSFSSSFYSLSFNP